MILLFYVGRGIARHGTARHSGEGRRRLYSCVVARLEHFGLTYGMDLQDAGYSEKYKVCHGVGSDRYPFLFSSHSLILARIPHTLMHMHTRTRRHSFLIPFSFFSFFIVCIYLNNTHHPLLFFSSLIPIITFPFLPTASPFTIYLFPFLIFFPSSSYAIIESNASNH